MIQFRPWIRWIERRACRTKDTGCGTKMIPRRRRKPESKNNTERNDLVWLSVSAVIVRRGKNTQGQSDCVRRKANWRNLSSRLTFYNDRILSHNQLTVTIELGVDLYRHISDTLKIFRLELRIETDWVADSVGLLGKNVGNAEWIFQAGRSAVHGINEQSSVILWNRSVTLLRLIPRPLEPTTVAVLPCVGR